MKLALNLDRPLVVFDIESTGLNTRQDRIVELAAVKVHPDGREESHCWLLNPTIPIPPETTAIHGISDEIVKNCPTFAECSREIYEFFEGCDISGFNSDRFDVPCLMEEFDRLGYAFRAGERKYVDVQRIFHRMEPRDLSAAVKFYCGREHDGAHGAEADARATLDVLKAQMERYPSLPKTTAELDEYLAPHDPLNADRKGLIRWIDGAWRINFGKKRGSKLSELFVHERNYIKWIINGDFDPDVRQICRSLLDNGTLPPPPAQSAQ